MSASRLTVLIVGATGMLGAHLARGFLLPEYRERVSLRLLVRKQTAEAAGSKKDALDALVASGAQLVFGDVTGSSEAELTEAFRGVEVLVSALGIPQLADQLHLIAPAKAAGVQWFVPSEFGDDAHLIGRGSAVPLFAVKLDVEAKVRSAGFPSLTFINTGVFSEYLISAFIGVDLAAGVITAPGSFDSATNTTPLAEIGRLTADAIVTGRGRNQMLWTGHYVTFADIADTIDRVTGKKIQRKVRTVADAEAAIAADPNDMSARFAVLYAKQAGEGMGVPDAESYATVYKLPQQSLEDFVRNIIKQS